MKPMSPVIPGSRIPEVVFAKNQPEYLQLPAHVEPDGRVVTRWAFTWKERFKILFGGNVWLQQLTFNAALQPVKLETVCPVARPPSRF